MFTYNFRYKVCDEVIGPDDQHAFITKRWLEQPCGGTESTSVPVEEFEEWYEVQFDDGFRFSGPRYKFYKICEGKKMNFKQLKEFVDKAADANFPG